MKSRLVLLLLAAHAGAALAQYKCTAANGAVTFQQMPCVGGQAEDKLVIIPNGHPPPASDARPATVIVRTAASASVGKPETSIDKRMLANYQHQQQREALAQSVAAAQDDAARRADQQTADIAATQRRFAGDLSNAQALDDALAAIDSRYRALAVIDNDRIRSAQTALDRWDEADKAQAAAAASATAK